MEQPFPEEMLRDRHAAGVDSNGSTSHECPADRVTGQSYDEVLKAYKEQVEFLRQELERKETLLMFLTQRIPELEVHSESRGPSEKPPWRTRPRVTYPRGNRRPHSLPPGGVGFSDSSRVMPSKNYWQKLFV